MSQLDKENQEKRLCKSDYFKIVLQERSGVDRRKAIAYISGENC